MFGVSKRAVKAARKIKKDRGICALSDEKVGKPLPKGISDSDFYEDEEFSRIYPGKKDYVSIRLDGIKIHKPKRLLLCNLGELYVAYREKYDAEIEDYNLLMGKVVCDLDTKDCMLQRCKSCPGEEALIDHLEEILEDRDMNETIEFKQWVHTDREPLETNVPSVENFIEKLASKIWKLTCDHFISKHLSKYLKSLKAALKEGQSMEKRRCKGREFPFLMSGRKINKIQRSSK
ncbi:hypothetical protein J437_LFUL008374 [Ladona fulva]|uniref:Uncharacterized protein n=1 Tax=Ladona fulva TaxID=123851 RepID=A0A8K0K8W7_LADFU|nr:hypothetical protein J437_LFUL008374 [Ladona fulva]